MMQLSVPKTGIAGLIVNIVTVALGIAAAYFMTIQSIRLDIATKAESDVVTQLDNKLSNLEIILKEGVATKEQFFELSRNIEIRLIRIESYLADQAGEKLDSIP